MKWTGEWRSQEKESITDNKKKVGFYLIHNLVLWLYNVFTKSNNIKHNQSPRVPKDLYLFFLIRLMGIRLLQTGGCTSS